MKVLRLTRENTKPFPADVQADCRTLCDLERRRMMQWYLAQRTVYKDVDAIRLAIMLVKLERREHGCQAEEIHA